MSSKADVIIIGAGLMGSATAMNLARAGKNVLLLDKEIFPCHASAVNAGGVRQLNRALEEIPLSAAAMQLWPELPRIVGSDCGFRPVGQVRIAPDDKALSVFEHRVSQVRAMGFEHETLVGPDEIRHLIPAYSGPCKGGMVSGQDGFALPALTLKHFYKAARSAGAQFMGGCQVKDIMPRSNGFEVVTNQGQLSSEILVNCAGAWGGLIARMAGDDLPVTPTGLAMMVTARMPKFIDPVVGVHGRKLSFKQMDNQTVVIGGALRADLDMTQEKGEIHMAQMRESAQTVSIHFECMKQAVVVRTWSGLEGMMDDKLPVIGPSRNTPGLFHVCGFSGHGFQLSPMVGRLSAALVMGKNPELDLACFSIDRFV